MAIDSNLTATRDLLLPGIRYHASSFSPIWEMDLQVNYVNQTLEIVAYRFSDGYKIRKIIPSKELYNEDYKKSFKKLINEIKAEITQKNAE